MSAAWKSYRVQGTHCASCEVLIESEVKKLQGVERVTVSHPKGELRVLVQDGTRLDAEAIEKVIAEHGYQVRSGAPQVHSRFTWERFVTGLAFIAVVYILLRKLGVLTFSPEVDAAAGMSAVFVVGLVAAFSSCTAVVGGLIAAVSARQAQRHPNASLTVKMRPHVLFNVGRLVGFAVFGALIGLLGSALQLSTTANGALTVVIAAFMIVLGFQLMGLIPAGLVQPPKRLSHWVHDLADRGHAWMPAVLGAATFFLPCGFTQSMQLFAMSTGSPVQGALIMTVFAFGTLPALLGIGYVTASAKPKSLPSLSYCIGAVVIALGIANVMNGATLLGVTGVVPADAVTGQAVVEGDAQVVAMAVTSAGVYAPSVLRVQAGIPVRWEVTRDAWVGCANSLVMPAFGIRESLAEGLNVITFTPDKAGTYTFSCAMGMVRGTMIVE